MTRHKIIIFTVICFSQYRTFAFGITKVTIPTKPVPYDTGVGIQEKEKMRLDSVLQRNGLSFKYLFRYLFKLNRVSPNAFALRL